MVQKKHLIKTSLIIFSVTLEGAIIDCNQLFLEKYGIVRHLNQLMDRRGISDFFHILKQDSTNEPITVKGDQLIVMQAEYIRENWNAYFLVIAKQQLTKSELPFSMRQLCQHLPLTIFCVNNDMKIVEVYGEWKNFYQDDEELRTVVNDSAYKHIRRFIIDERNDYISTEITIRLNKNKIQTCHAYIKNVGNHCIIGTLPVSNEHTEKVKKIANLSLELDQLHENSLQKYKRIEQKQAKLQRLSHTDSLTGLYNRRFFDKQVEVTFNQGVPFTLVMIDINNFKYINDTYGHYEGDRVLQKFASITKDVLRNKDSEVYRYGGDEFLIILFDCQSEKDARQVGEEINQLLKQAFNGVSISYGATVVIDFESKRVEDYLKQVDYDMYSYKRLTKPN